MTRSDLFALPSGRWIHLQELRQYRTYEGLLNGLPTVEGNRRRLESLVAEHRGRPYPGEPYLIAPVETPLDNCGRPYPFGTPSALPSITCIGRFTSTEPARDESHDGSGLVVLWLQEAFAFPIDPDVVERILAIDWETHAADLIY